MLLGQWAPRDHRRARRLAPSSLYQQHSPRQPTHGSQLIFRAARKADTNIMPGKAQRRRDHWCWPGTCNADKCLVQWSRLTSIRLRLRLRGWDWSSRLPRTLSACHTRSFTQIGLETNEIAARYHHAAGRVAPPSHTSSLCPPPWDDGTCITAAPG